MDKELSEIIKNIEESSSGAKVKDQLKELIQCTILKRFVVLSSLFTLSMIAGNTVSIAYTVSIFESAKIKSFNSYLGAVLTGISRITGLSLFLLISDRFSRKLLTIIFTFLAGISMAALGIFFKLQSDSYDVSSLSWLPIVSIISYHCFITISYTNIMVLRTELLPTSVRSLGIGMLSVIVIIAAFITLLIFPFMEENLGSHWTFWIFSLATFIMVLIVQFFVPETKGKTLEELGHIKRKYNKSVQN